MINLKLVLDRRVAILDQGISQAQYERDHAATPTESHSDQTRQVADQLVASLETEKRILLQQVKNLSRVPPIDVIGQNTIVTFTSDNVEKRVLLVPDGLGGETVDGVLLLSVSTPLGQALLGKKVFDRFDFLGTSICILNLTPNFSTKN